MLAKYATELCGLTSNFCLIVSTSKFTTTGFSPLSTKKEFTSPFFFIELSTETTLILLSVVIEIFCTSLFKIVAHDENKSPSRIIKIFLFTSYILIKLADRLSMTHNEIGYAMLETFEATIQSTLYKLCKVTNMTKRLIPHYCIPDITGLAFFIYSDSLYLTSRN